RAMKRFVFPMIMLLSLGGCATTYNPATERNEFIYISTPQEVEMGNDINHSIDAQYKVSRDKALTTRVERIGQDLVLVSDRQDYAYHFHVIEKDEMNAFTVPGGHVYIFTGLLDKLKSDDQIASVLAHEIGHCAARHAVKKFQAALGYDLIGRIVLSQIDSGAAQQVAGLSSNAIMSIVFSSYGRKDEFEADRLGVKYMYLAGYKPEAIIETFEILKQGEKGPSMPAILRTHPFLDDRIRTVRQEIAKVGEK